QGPGRFRRERRRRARIARKLAGAGGGEGGKTARPLSAQWRKQEALRGLEEEALMFFILSKTVGFVLLPSNFLLLLALAARYCSRRAGDAPACAWSSAPSFFSQWWGCSRLGPSS